MSSRDAMAHPKQLDVFSKPLAWRLSAMIEAKLLTSRGGMPWADSVLERLGAPPVWLLDLTVTKYYPHAADHPRRYACSEPSEPGFEWDGWVDDYVASLY